MIGLALAAGLLLAAADEPKFDRDCMDEQARDLCAEAVQASVRKRLGAESAEALAARSVEGVRVFAVNGYGVDQPMVSILWSGKAAPVIEARIDRDVSGPSVLTFEGNNWHRASTTTLMGLTAASSPRQLDSKPKINTKGELTLCLHAWVVVVEAIESGRVHRRVRNACGDDPVFEGAFQFASLAVNSSEACRALAATDYRTDWDRLEVCPAILGPNVGGAAAVLRLSTGDILDDGSYPAGETTERLAPEAVWRTPEGTRTGQAEVAAAWRRFGAGAEAPHWVRTATGTGSVVEVNGIAVRETESQTCHAASHQQWRRTSGRWRLESWTLEPCLPFGQPDPGRF
jgi:hypothetical protein